MRGTYRRKSTEEEEESVFISMTDMTVSFLFIVMILLAFFASQISLADEDEQETVAKTLYEKVRAERDALRLELEKLQDELRQLQVRLEQVESEKAQLERDMRDLRAEIERLLAQLAEEREKRQKAEDRVEELLSETEALKARVEQLEEQVADLEALVERLKQLVSDPLEKYFAEVSAQREKLLRRLRDAILVDFPDLDVVISSESDALRFQGEGLFRSGSAVIRPDRIALIQKIAEKLDDVLGCYTIGPQARFSEDCNAAYALVEAVQIEGHTDSDGSDSNNIRLSAQRGANTYITMTGHADSLLEHRNLDGEPVLSLAGYGESRPVATNETAEGKSANRRIDLRFIMVTPRANAEIQKIRERLREATAGAGAE